MKKQHNDALLETLTRIADSLQVIAELKAIESAKALADVKGWPIEKRKALFEASAKLPPAMTTKERIMAEAGIRDDRTFFKHAKGFKSDGTGNYLLKDGETIKARFAASVKRRGRKTRLKKSRKRI